MFIELEGKRIHYTKNGKGKSIVLLHGFLENLTIWNDFASKLISHFNVIQIDLPGHGKTEVFGKTHSMSLMASVIHTVLEKEGIQEVFIVGHSMGGYVALEFAKQYRNFIIGLCLFNSTALADSKIKKEERNRVVKVMQKNSKRFIEEAIPNLFTVEKRSDLKEIINELILEAKENPTEGIIACTYGMRDRADSLNYLKTIDYPVLYIIGRRDPIIPFEKYKEQIYANNMINVYISGIGGHMCFIEDCNGSFGVLKNFAHSIMG